MVLRRYLQRALQAEKTRRRRPAWTPSFTLTPCTCPASAPRHRAVCTFLEARAFVEDPSALVVALCGRRAGKSSAARQKLVKTALAHAGKTSVIVGPTRVACKKLHWAKLQALLRAAGVPFTANATELTLRLFNGSEIWLAGAKDQTEIERLRGHDFVLVIVDEAGVIRDSILRSLVEDVLQWALIDHGGQLLLIGTPPLVPVGFFVERFTGVDGKGNPVLGWSRHRWTLFENSLLPNRAVRAYLDQLRRDRGLTEQHVTWRREVLGELVYDRDALVLSAFDLEGSVYRPDQLPKGARRVVLGVDVGFHDNDAIVALAWFSDSPNLYVVEEWQQPHQTEEMLGAKIREFIAKYHPQAIVGDTGGGGKKTIEGISRRIKWQIEPAHKPSVVEQFARVNDEFRAGKLFVPAGGHCAEDAIRLRWTPGKTGVEVAKEPHSDALPALSYAYAKARHYYHVAPEPEPEKPKHWAEAVIPGQPGRRR